MDTNKIKSDFQLLKTSVVSLDIKNNFVEYDEHESGTKTIDIAYKIIDDRTIEPQKIHGGSVDLHITVASKIGENVYIIKMIFRGFFSAPISMEHSTFSRMLVVNGTASLYTMARAVLLSISSLMFTGGSILLPMVNMTRFHEYSDSAAVEKNETE